MKLTTRGQGVAAGLVLACIVILAIIFHGGAYKMENGEPQKIESVCDAECMESWRVDTESDKPSDLPGGAKAKQFNEVPVDENGEYVTNPCAYEMQMVGVCEGGW